jgi:hypothetical protein
MKMASIAHRHARELRIKSTAFEWVDIVVLAISGYRNIGNRAARSHLQDRLVMKLRRRRLFPLPLRKPSIDYPIIDGMSIQINLGQIAGDQVKFVQRRMPRSIRSLFALDNAR